MFFDASLGSFFHHSFLSFVFSFACDFHAALTEAGGGGLMPFAAAAAESCVPHLTWRWSPSGRGWVQAAWLCRGGCGQVGGLKPLPWRDVPGYPSSTAAPHEGEKLLFFWLELARFCFLAVLIGARRRLQPPSVGDQLLQSSEGSSITPQLEGKALWAGLEHVRKTHRLCKYLRSEKSESFRLCTNYLRN